MRRRGLGRIGIVIAVCTLALSLGVSELAAPGGAAPLRATGRAHSASAGRHVTLAGDAQLVALTLVRKAKVASGNAGSRQQAKKPKLKRKISKAKKKPKVKKQPGRKVPPKKKKKKKKKKKAVTSGLHNPLMLLLFAAISGLALFLIGSSLMSTPRARARARDRQRVRKPATPGA
jgi:hypothetical protein